MEARAVPLSWAGLAHPTDSPLATDPTPVVLPSDRDATGRDLGDRELELLAVAVRSGHLNSTGGTLVPRLAREFASRHGVPHAIACASGSAAVHAALGALGLRPGDEVVTTPITDIGAVLPIVYEGATPVFADVDPVTLNVTADSLTAAITTRTRAVIVTHLFGQPCRMEPILALAQRHGFAVIEDAAQAFLATDGGRLCGTMGDLGCFSFQQGKHMTTGEGGIVVSSNKDLASGVQRFVDKGWGYGDPKPDHDRPGLNYRLTELQGAVGIAQLEKLDGCVQRRRASARALCEALADLEDQGVGLPIPAPGTEHSYWRFALRIDPERIPGGAVALGAHLTACGVQNAPRYVQKPAFDCAVFRERDRFGAMAGVFPTEGPLGDRSTHPGCYAGLERVLVLPWNEHYRAEHVDFIAMSVRRAVAAVHAAGAGGA